VHCLCSLPQRCYSTACRSAAESVPPIQQYLSDVVADTVPALLDQHVQYDLPHLSEYLKKYYLEIPRATSTARRAASFHGVVEKNTNSKDLRKRDFAAKVASALSFWVLGLRPVHKSGESAARAQPVISSTFVSAFDDPAPLSLPSAEVYILSGMQPVSLVSVTTASTCMPIVHATQSMVGMQEPGGDTESLLEIYAPRDSGLDPDHVSLPSERNCDFSSLQAKKNPGNCDKDQPSRSRGSIEDSASRRGSSSRRSARKLMAESRRRRWGEGAGRMSYQSSSRPRSRSPASCTQGHSPVCVERASARSTSAHHLVVRDITVMAMCDVVGTSLNRNWDSFDCFLTSSPPLHSILTVSSQPPHFLTACGAHVFLT